MNGQNSHIIHQTVNTVFKLLKKKKIQGDTPLDNLVLRMHSKWGFYLTLFIFSVVSYSWYVKDQILCVSQFNAELQIRLDYLNICYSYIYTTTIDGTGNNRYIFFYKWLPYVMLSLAFVYYLPHKLRKVLDNPRLSALMEEIQKFNVKYDPNSDRQSLDQALSYVGRHFWGHSTLYYSNLVLCLFCLLIDTIVFFFLDWLLHNRFFYLGMASLSRDFENFSDYISVTFPPIANCELGPETLLTGKRVERLGCHLPLMELYEKLFLLLWHYLVIAIVVTVLYLIYNLMFLIPSNCKFFNFRKHVLSIRKPSFVDDDENMSDLLNDVLKISKVGDVYTLYFLKSKLSNARYYQLLCGLRIDELRSIKINMQTVPQIKCNNKNQRSQNCAPMGKMVNAGVPQRMMQKPSAQMNHR